jgi:hypothetical protein
VRNAAGAGEAGLFEHVAELAVDGDDDLGADPVVHGGKLGPARVAGDMDRSLLVGDHLDALCGQLVLDAADGDLVAGNLLGGEDDEIAPVQAQLVLIEGDPGERGTRLPLPARGDDHHLAPGQTHGLVKIDRLREISEIAHALRNAEDAIETAPGDADAAAGVLRDVAQSLQPRRVGGEGGDEHTAVGRLDHCVEALADAEFRARRRVLEDVGRIAGQSEHAGVADRAQLRLRRGIAKLRRVVELPVAGVEDAAVRRVDQQRVALGDRMGERDVAEAERPEPEIALHLDCVELHLPGQPLLLQLAGDQPGGERRRVERHAEIVGEIRNGADMVLMAVGEDDAEQVLAPLLDEGEIGQDQFDAGIGRIGEGEAKVDHDPFALAAVEIDVHANLAGAAEREEEQFLAGFHGSLTVTRRPGSAGRAWRGPGW